MSERYGVNPAKPKASIHRADRRKHLRETAVCTYSTDGKAVYRQPGSNILPVHNTVHPITYTDKDGNQRSCTLRESDSFALPISYRPAIVVRLKPGVNGGLSDSFSRLNHFCNKYGAKRSACSEVYTTPKGDKRSLNGYYYVYGLDRLSWSILERIAYGLDSDGWISELSEVAQPLAGNGDVKHIAPKPSKPRSKPAKRKRVDLYEYADRSRRNTAKFILSPECK